MGSMPDTCEYCRLKCRHRGKKKKPKKRRCKIARKKKELVFSKT